MNNDSKRYNREVQEPEIMTVQKSIPEHLEVPPTRDMKELSQNFSSQRKNLKKTSPRYNSNIDNNKMLKGESSPNKSIVSGLSIIS